MINVKEHAMALNNEIKCREMVVGQSKLRTKRKLSI